MGHPYSYQTFKQDIIFCLICSNNKNVASPGMIKTAKYLLTFQALLILLHCFYILHELINYLKKTLPFLLVAFYYISTICKHFWKTYRNLFKIRHYKFTRHWFLSVICFILITAKQYKSIHMRSLLSSVFTILKCASVQVLNIWIYCNLQICVHRKCFLGSSFVLLQAYSLICYFRIIQLLYILCIITCL